MMIYDDLLCLELNKTAVNSYVTAQRLAIASEAATRVSNNKHGNIKRTTATKHITTKTR